MKCITTALVAIFFGTNVYAGFRPPVDDAALHAVQFVDRNEGWAVGDDGIAWHTIDGGKNWERQQTGTRASLRGIHFLTPYMGWVVGREELPNGAGSRGIALFTSDGGLKWQPAGINGFPGLNVVKFTDARNGYVAGDGTERYPSGLFVTADAGQTWKPVPGPRCPTWHAMSLQNSKSGAMAGAWNRLAFLHDGKITAADVDLLGGRTLRGLQLHKERAVAVGEGGLVLMSETAGARWGYVDSLPLVTEVRATWDFHAVHCQDDHVWIVGRPGSRVLYSADAGRSWQVRPTGQSLPLNSIFFVDKQTGWAVGELGTVIHTNDGGNTWCIQRRGGQRSAVMCVHARSSGLPLDTVALLGGQEGYLTIGIRATTADPGSTAMIHSTDPQRLTAAVRQAGGVTGDVLWQFPLPQHLARSDKKQLLESWDRLHSDRSAEQLLRQMVLALRMWRPSVVVTDHPNAAVTGMPVEALIAEVVHEAFRRANDPKQFPEQIEILGLEPWQPQKLYGVWHEHAGSHVSVDMNEPSALLEATPRDFAAPAFALLNDETASPAQRHYRLLATHLETVAGEKDLMNGVLLSPGGPARRQTPELGKNAVAALQAVRTRRNIQRLAETSASELAAPPQLLAQVGPTLATLPANQAAPAAFAVASQFARQGHWQLASEVYRLLLDRYPAHPLAADACRWLIQHDTSSEARHRHQMSQFMLMKQSDVKASSKEDTTGTKTVDNRPKSAIQTTAHVDDLQSHTLSLLRDPAETKRSYQQSLATAQKLAALGPIHADDPSVQFCLQAARRNLGEFEAVKNWCTDFRDRSAPGPWRDAAAAELWLANRTAHPPRPAALCRRTNQRPHLDGVLDDPCWQGVKPMVLQNAVGNTMNENTTEAWLAYDQQHLYLALRCKHPEGRQVELVKARARDADLTPFDRVTLLLDLDRDYTTYYRLEVDQRGCVREDCWGDRTWNPRWFVACHSDKDCWQIEAAIPLAELTGEPMSLGQAWACNLVRVLPGRGVQAWCTPADVEPRPEGMGLLMFAPETRDATKKPGATSAPGVASGGK